MFVAAMLVVMAHHVLIKLLLLDITYFLSTAFLHVTSEARQLLAKVAVGNSSLPPEFYSSLHEKKVIPQEKKQKDSLQGPIWDLVRCQGTDDNDGDVNDGDDDWGPQKSEEEELHQKIEQVFTDVMKRIKESTVVAEGAKVFCKRYFDMQKKEKFANATIGSALYKFGWKHGGTIKSTHARRLLLSWSKNPNWSQVCW